MNPPSLEQEIWESWTIKIKKTGLFYKWIIVSGAESYESFGWYFTERFAYWGAKNAIAMYKEQHKPDNIVYEEKL